MSYAATLRHPPPVVPSCRQPSTVTPWSPPQEQTTRHPAVVLPYEMPPYEKPSPSETRHLPHYEPLRRSQLRKTPGDFAFWSAALLLCSAEPRIVPDPSPWPAHANFAVPPESPIDDVPGRLVMLDSPILGCLPRSPCRNACSDP
ncbi:hypothetical protein HPB51_003516 [Rhipicephalus microplus]|uniref:Uncharacterized protein n=1 Tax=Rhipicephalus microplus TaxID=6941 RepID=A0A9J6DY32_RHIMP|nr:hypothetical protein HPB51_003516 [Rhipicephalus microplus]